MSGDGRPDTLFARCLYAKGYYALAALEWARLLNSAEGASTQEAEIELAYCLWHLERTDDCLRVLDDLIGTGTPVIRAHARAVKTMVALSTGAFGEAADAAEKALAPGEVVKDALRTDYRKCIAARRLVEGDTGRAVEILREHELAEESLVTTIQAARFPRRSPALAGGLSALIPGAGQAYCGRWKEAGAAFVVNGLLIGSAYESFDTERPILGSTIAFLAVGWYIGNVYNALNVAHKHNDEGRAHIVVAWLRDLDIQLSEEGVRMAFGLSF
ncbi:hypothetical protein ACFLSJ_06740 [Verrucomicrobiota bacterium]